jgi:hypothetical protein
LLGTKIYSISAGLAYGSKHIQMLNSCKNCWCSVALSYNISSARELCA